MGMVAKAGFYGGKFLKAGQHFDGDVEATASTPDLDAMNKDELTAEDDRHGVEIKSDMLKADILAALKGQANAS